MKQWMFSVAGAVLAIGLHAQDQKPSKRSDSMEERLATYQRELQLTDVQMKEVHVLLEGEEPALQKLKDQQQALNDEMRRIVMAQEEKMSGILSPEQAQQFKRMRSDGPAVFHAEGCNAAVVNGELRCCAGMHSKKKTNEEVAKEKAKAAAAAEPQRGGLRDANSGDGKLEATPQPIRKGDR